MLNKSPKNRSNGLSMNSKGNQVLKCNWWKNRSNGHPFYSCRFYQTWAQFASSNNTEAPAHIFLAVKFSISVPICVGVLRDSDWPWEPAKWILHPLSNFRVQKISILKQAVVTNALPQISFCFNFLGAAKQVSVRPSECPPLCLFINSKAVHQALLDFLAP